MRKAGYAISHVNIVDNLLRPVNVFIDGIQKAGQTTKVEAAWAHYGALWRLHGLACPLPPSKENCWSRLPTTMGRPGLSGTALRTMTNFDGNVRSGSAQVLGASLGLTEFTHRPNTPRHPHHRDPCGNFSALSCSPISHGSL